MKFKKWLSLLLALSLIVGTFSGLQLNAFAGDTVTVSLEGDGVLEFTSMAGYTTNATSSTEELVEDFEYIEETYSGVISAIVSAAESHETYLKISSYGITEDEIGNILEYVYYNKFCYYLYSYNYNLTSNGTINYLKLNYSMSESTITKGEAIIEAEAAAIAEEASQFDTEVEQMLYVHDWLVGNLDYDSTGDQTYNNVYGAFVDNCTMCVGYSTAFYYIMDLLGIDCYLVISNRLSHMWNLVYLDGEFYYVDCTFDDLTYSSINLAQGILSGQYRYSNFLVSDLTLYQNSHVSTDWTVNGVDIYTCASDTYDDFFWQDISTSATYEITYSNGYWYYETSTYTSKSKSVYMQIYEVEFLSNTEYTVTEVVNVASKWVYSGGSYTAFYTNFQTIGDFLYYRTNDGIYLYVQDGDDILVFENTSDENIFDFVINDDYTFTVVYGDKKTDDGTYETYNLADYFCATQGHDYEDVVTEPTCVDIGYTTYTCTICSGTYVDDYTDATGVHTYEWVTTSNSYLEKTCSVCSDVKVTLAFTDISAETEYFDYIAYTSYYNSLITGVKANSTDTTTETFSPRTSLTRAMLVTILYRMAGSPYDDENPYTETPFSDVVAGVWYYNAVCWALDNGITTETKFKPNTDVTREQTATFLYRYAGEYLGQDVSTDNDISSYPDATSVSAYAEEAMAWANAYGMITGTQQGYLNPQGTTLRVHVTKILYNFGLAYSVGNFES